MSPNDADEMANRVDPDQTAPLGAVLSGSALFAQGITVRKHEIITGLTQYRCAYNLRCIPSFVHI